MIDLLTNSIRSCSQEKFQIYEERFNNGKQLRKQVKRSGHGEWEIKKEERDPVAILEESNLGRVAELVPLRYGRMLASPFTFLRGAASLMAYDLSSTPNTGIWVQACGDCHLLNFGLFGTPERQLIFDLNDFDETLPAPWEWDLKRLVVSFVVAGRDNGISDEESLLAVSECVRHYRERLWQYSHQSPLDVWYDHLDAETIIGLAPDAESKKFRQKVADKARKRVIEHHYPKIVTHEGETPRIADQPPLIFHVQRDNWEDLEKECLEGYRASLGDELKILFDRYSLEDTAVKVVGIGSVGTRCYISLFFSEDNHPLVLQIKEARRSVLEPYTAKSFYQNQGQRVIVGQRLLQSSSDIFLGWSRANGYDFYVRQLRDMKLSVSLEVMNAVQLKRYAEYCGWTLARAHAKSGDTAAISGYLGATDNFDRALTRFAIAYANQNERDYECLVEAVKSGRLKAFSDSDS